jgi:HEAT repeat protein
MRCRRAARVLEQIGPPAVPALITALGDADAQVRQNAAGALGQIGLPAAEAVPTLIAALQDPDQEVIKAAKKALERIQSPSLAPNYT